MTSIDEIEVMAERLGELAHPLLKQGSQFSEVLWSGRKTIESASSFEAIRPSIESTPWFKPVAAYADTDARVPEGLRKLIEMICALPHEKREEAISRSSSALQRAKKS